MFLLSVAGVFPSCYTTPVSVCVCTQCLPATQHLCLRVCVCTQCLVCVAGSNL